MFDSIIFSSNLFVLCVLLGLSYALFLYFRQQEVLNKKLFYFLTFLRFAFITLLAFLILDPVIKSSTKIFEKPIIVILQDASQSIKENLKVELDNFSNELDDVEIYKYHFSDKLHEGFSEKNTGIYTNYSNILDDINSRFSNKNLSSVIVATDGLYNNGSNPLYSDVLETPIHTICLGDTNIIRDNRIADVKHNDIVFLGNDFITEIYVESDKFKGNNLLLKVERQGKLVFKKTINISSDKEFLKVPVELAASDMGIQSYKASVSVLKAEKNISNNSYNFYIDVINSKYKILLIHDFSHPDIAAFVSVMDSNKDYDLEVSKADDFEGNLFDYNLVVLHSISEKNKNLITSLSTKNIPVLIFCKQNYSFYSSLMPRLKFKNRSSNNEVFASVNNDFNSFNISNEIKDMINSMPPLVSSFGVYDVSPSLNLMLNQRVASTITNDPICVFDNIDDKKVGLLIGEGWWRWKLKDYQLNNNSDNFNSLINKITQYLLIKEDKSKFRLLYDKEFDQNNSILFEAEVYNDNYELDNSDDIRLTLTNTDKEEYTFLFDRTDDKYYLDVGDLEYGNYNIVAKIEKSGVTKKGSFFVKPVQIESLKTVADHQLLFNLSQQTGGQFFSVDNLNDLIQVVNSKEEKQTITSFEDTLKQVIDIEWILLILLLLISIEWFFRKYNGLI
jgi:hypothetical protein